jgi:cytochrome c oxidase assembly protein subunit 15
VELSSRNSQLGTRNFSDKIRRFPGDLGLISAANSYNQSHHRFAVFVVCATFLLLIAGGLVTSNDASLAVPDWPTSFGSFHMPRMVGGVLYEHGHRMIAATITLLVFALAVWTWIVDRQRYLRALTALAVVGVLTQAVLGGLSVLSANWADPRWRLALATGHGVFGQIMFVLLASVALLTSRSWRLEPAVMLPAANATKLRFWTGLLVFMLLLQLVLGAAFRHVWTKWGPAAAERIDPGRIVAVFLVPHILNAILTAAVLVIATVMVMKRAGANRSLKMPAMLLHILLLAQLMLGVGAFFTRVVWHMDIPQPQAPLVWTTVSHQTVGALMLLTATILAIQVRRALPKREALEAKESISVQKAVTA